MAKDKPDPPAPRRPSRIVNLLDDDKILVQRPQGRTKIDYRFHGMSCGTACFLACIGSFTYLVSHGHETPAYTILSATVIGIVAQMIHSK